MPENRGCWARGKAVPAAGREIFSGCKRRTLSRPTFGLVVFTIERIVEPGKWNAISGSAASVDFGLELDSLIVETSQGGIFLNRSLDFGVDSVSRALSGL